MGSSQDYFKGYVVHTDTITMSSKDVRAINIHATALCDMLDVFNNLSYPIYIGYRDGTKFTVLPRNNPSLEQGLYFTRRVNFHKNHTHVHLVDSSLHGRDNLNVYNSYVKAMNGEVVCQDGFFDQYNYNQVYQQFFVSGEDLAKKRTYYLSNLDIVVSLDGPSKWEHPYSLEGAWRRQQIDARPPRSSGDDVMYFNIELVVERQSETGERYVNLSGHVFRVPVVFRIDKAPGIYITHVGHTTKDDPPKREESQYYKWGEMDKAPIQLYKSYFDAQNHGDIEAYHKEELLRMEHRNKQLSAEIEALKLKTGKEKIQAESQMVGRKELIEFLKWAPAVIGGIIGLINVLRQIGHPPPTGK